MATTLPVAFLQTVQQTPVRHLPERRGGQFILPKLFGQQLVGGCVAEKVSLCRLQ
jgi:hypothetical protein